MKRSLLFLLAAFLGSCALKSAYAYERDPFVSIIDEREERKKIDENRIEISQVRVKGIIWNESRPVAILNEGDLVTLNDLWMQYKVESIDKESVTLSDAGKKYRLYVNGSPQGTEKTDAKMAKIEKQGFSIKGETLFLRKDLINGAEK